MEIAGGESDRRLEREIRVLVDDDVGWAVVIVRVVGLVDVVEADRRPLDTRGSTF
jgi:hypothetical protein